jgi:hypothetical protein
MIGIREYAWPQENVLIDIHEGYVSIDRKKSVASANNHTEKRKNVPIKNI